MQIETKKLEHGEYDSRESFVMKKQSINLPSVTDSLPAIRVLSCTAMGINTIIEVLPSTMMQTSSVNEGMLVVEDERTVA